MHCLAWRIVALLRIRPTVLTNTYSKRQELTTRSRTDTPPGLTSTVTAEYGYDDESRLTQAVTDTGGLLGTDTETFTLDGVGNRTAHSKILGSWDYDANNRLTEKGLLDKTTYAYDDAGSLTQKTQGGIATNYVYDSQHRLVEVKGTGGNPIARYGYDPMGRRIWKEAYRNQDGAPLAQALRSYYLYSDEGLIAESQQPITPPLPVGEGWGEGVTATAPPKITTQYGPKPDSEFTTATLFVKTKNSAGQNTIAYYHHDHLGTPIQATDKAGNIVWSAQYNVFGQAAITTPTATFAQPTIASDLRFPGQVYDEETGLHYNWHRYYDPGLGRYVTADPVGLAGGVNFYAYVGGNPVNLTDPTGLNPLVTRIVLGGAARVGFPNAARMAAEAVGGGVVGCILTGYCSAADDADSDEAESCPPEKRPLKTREKRNKERREKPKDPEEAERRKNDNHDKKRRSGRGGSDPSPTGEDW